MDSSKRILLSTVGIAVLVVLLSGITFAFFNYTKTGLATTIRVGRISFVTRQTETINLTNIFPIASSEATGENPNYDEVVIEIVGDTDYSEGIEYLVSAVDSNIYTNEGQLIPISLDMTVDGLGTSNANYFIARENTNTSIYKKIVGDTIVGDQMLLVGFILPNDPTGTADGIDGSITIKAYLDKNKILISDTYDGTESDNMGTTSSMASGKTVISTTEWNALQSTGVSFKVKVEANEGIWVTGSLEEIMKKSAVMDNINSDYVNNQTPGIRFGTISSDTNGKGVYMRAGTENDTYPILYYRGEVTDNNVIFANQCWKAVRTTDTGGVKLIYNGTPKPIYNYEPIDLSDYIIDTTKTDSRWTFDSNDKTWNIEINDGTHPQIEFNISMERNYVLELTGTSGSNCGGQYSFYKNNVIVNAYGNGGGSPMDLSYDYGLLITTDKIKMNYDGSSSSSCIITFKLQMLGESSTITNNGCNNEKLNSSIGSNVAFNDSDSSLTHVGYMYGNVYDGDASDWIENVIFANDFTWDGTIYKLIGPTVTTPDSTHHYSCNMTDENDTCTDLRYVYLVNGNYLFYIVLHNGKSVTDVLNEMKINATDSKIKNKIETWFASNMENYTNRLEDTIWCNDRSMNSDNGWNANGGDISNTVLYGIGNRKTPYLGCINKDDSFTWNNENGNKKLLYPVGLLTIDEVVLAGGGNDSNELYYLNSKDSYWTMSPFSYENSFSALFSVEHDGKFGGRSSIFKLSIRPSVSLKHGTPVISGSGTVADPYVIE